MLCSHRRNTLRHNPSYVYVCHFPCHISWGDSTNNVSDSKTISSKDNHTFGGFRHVPPKSTLRRHFLKRMQLLLGIGLKEVRTSGVTGSLSASAILPSPPLLPSQTEFFAGIQMQQGLPTVLLHRLHSLSLDDFILSL